MMRNKTIHRVLFLSNLILSFDRVKWRKSPPSLQVTILSRYCETYETPTTLHPGFGRCGWDVECRNAGSGDYKAGSTLTIRLR